MGCRCWLRAVGKALGEEDFGSGGPRSAEEPEGAMPLSIRGSSIGWPGVPAVDDAAGPADGKPVMVARVCRRRRCSAPVHPPRGKVQLLFSDVLDDGQAGEASAKALADSTRRPWRRWPTTASSPPPRRPTACACCTSTSTRDGRAGAPGRVDRHVGRGRPRSWRRGPGLGSAATCARRHLTASAHGRRPEGMGGAESGGRSRVPGQATTWTSTTYSGADQTLTAALRRHKCRITVTASARGAAHHPPTPAAPPAAVPMPTSPIRSTSVRHQRHHHADGHGRRGSAPA